MPNRKIKPEPPRECDLCPRLVAFRTESKLNHPDWFNGAVPSFEPPGGAKDVRLLVVGLAPGLQGANRTGRPFTGDWAGDLLYPTMLKFGFATGSYEARPNDSLQLAGAMITNAVRCVPPQNKPVGSEMANCRQFLVARIESLPALQVVICLGRVAHENTLSAIGEKRAAHAFGHGTEHRVCIQSKPIAMIDSYHCSRYNTNTGRLTTEMFESVFSRAKELISEVD